MIARLRSVLLMSTLPKCTNGINPYQRKQKLATEQPFRRGRACEHPTVRSTAVQWIEGRPWNSCSATQQMSLMLAAF